MKNKFKAFAIIKTILLIMAVFLMLVLPAYGGTDDGSGFTMSVTGIRYLTLENGSVAFTPEPEQMINGWTTEEQSVVWVSANVPWVLTIRGSEDYWEGPWAKPVSDIYWRYGTSEFIPLGTTSETIAIDGPVSSEQFLIDLKIKLDMENDLPGDYTYSYVVFEISAP